LEFLPAPLDFAIHTIRPILFNNNTTWSSCFIYM